MGSKFIISRYPRLPDRITSPDKDRPDGRNTQPVKEILHVIGGDIDKENLAKARQVFGALASASNVRNQEKVSISVLVNLLADRPTDILQYTCHGHLNPPLLQISENNNQVENLIIEGVKDLPIAPGCMVFVNSCSSSAPTVSFGKFTSFGWEFYKSGAEVFIGALGQIPTRYAISFAECLYRHVYEKNGNQTIGEILHLARQDAQKERNLFWLLYTLYGNPHKVLNFSKTEIKN